MLYTIRIYRYLLPFWLVFIPATTQSQILKNPETTKIVRNGIEAVYNLSFDEAREAARLLKMAYPQNPVNFLFNGMITYWEGYPLLPDSPGRASFESDMRRCIEICESEKNPPDEAEYMLANLSARGFLMLFYSDNDMSKEVIPLAISSYKYIRRSFEYTSAYSDFCFFTGMYNYYREVYPAVYPVYKPVTILFPKGDRIKGLKELDLASKTSLFLKAEASQFLSSINLSFENNFQKAFEYSRSLHDLYPSNPEFLSLFIRNLLLIGQYDEAERHIARLEMITTSRFFTAQLHIYHGIVAEKKYHDMTKAESNYRNGIEEMSAYGYFGSDFTAYGYFGLSRLCKLRNDTDNSRSYRKKALELADFQNVNFD